MWSTAWFWWLLVVLVSWFVMEVASIIAAHVRGERHIMTWTLSETIRRWSDGRRWLAPVAIGTACFLLAHFFLVENPL
jgi:hypothetical protein